MRLLRLLGEQQVKGKGESCKHEKEKSDSENSPEKPFTLSGQHLDERSYTTSSITFIGK